MSAGSQTPLWGGPHYRHGYRAAACFLYRRACPLIMLSLAEKATMYGVLTARTVKERLVEQLASDAAESEHRHTAFGLHEGVIPPYIALQIGLTAVRQKLGRGQAASSGRSID